MSTIRIKTFLKPTIENRDQMEALLAEIAVLKARDQKLNGQLSEQLVLLRKGFAHDLNEIAEKLEARMALAREWAEANPGEFGQGRSIVMTHGTIGFRLGNVCLKTIKGFTWERVLEKLRASSGWKNYIRVNEEVSKEKLLADRATYSDEDFASIGVRVCQAETFFIEPRLESTEVRLQEAA